MQPYTDPAKSVNIDCTVMANEKDTQAEVRAEAARRRDGRHAAADHRGGCRAARDDRAGAHDTQRRRRAGRRPAPHRLSPLPHRGELCSARARRTTPRRNPCPTRSPGARSATRASGSRARWTSSTPTTSAPNRCSARSSATSSSSTQSARARAAAGLPGRGGRDPGGRLGCPRAQTTRPRRRAAPRSRLPDVALAHGRATASPEPRPSSSPSRSSQSAAEAERARGRRPVASWGRPRPLHCRTPVSIAPSARLPRRLR